jgi:hypothetical protein
MCDVINYFFKFFLTSFVENSIFNALGFIMKGKMISLQIDKLSNEL